MVDSEKGKIILNPRNMPAAMKDRDNFSEGIPDDVKIIIADIVLDFAQAESLLNQGFRVISFALFNKAFLECGEYDRNNIFRVMIGIAKDMEHVDAEKLWRLFKQHKKGIEFVRNTICHSHAQGMVAKPESSVFFCGVDKFEGYYERALPITTLETIRGALSMHCEFLMGYIQILMQIVREVYAERN